MPPRKKPTLLAQGKPRTLSGSARPWRVRLHAPQAGVTKYQVMFRAPAGEGEPLKRVLRRANSEAEARKIFDQAEAALDTEKDMPAGADLRASRTIRMLGLAYVNDSIERGKQPLTMEQRVSRLSAHILPTIGDVPVAKWRVQHSRAVMEKGSKTLFSTRGREDLRGQLAAMRKLAWRLGLMPVKANLCRFGRSTCVYYRAMTFAVEPPAPGSPPRWGVGPGAGEVPMDSHIVAAHDWPAEKQRQLFFGLARHLFDNQMRVDVNQRYDPGNNEAWLAALAEWLGWDDELREQVITEAARSAAEVLSHERFTPPEEP